jgi:hypothetical protein
MAFLLHGSSVYSQLQINGRRIGGGGDSRIRLFNMIFEGGTSEATLRKAISQDFIPGSR